VYVALASLLLACGSPGRVGDGGSSGDSAVPEDASRDASRVPDAAPLVDAATDAPLDADVPGDASADAGARPVPALLALNLRCLDQSDTPYATVAERMRAIAQEVVRQNVVALLLEEVCDDGTTRALDLLRSELSTRSGEEWRADEVFAHIAWEGTPREARESVAVLTRTAHTSVRSIEFFAQGALRRVAVLATLGAPFDGLRVMAVHFDHRDADARLGQAREAAVASSASYGAAGALIGGDLNARVGSPPLEALLAMGFEDQGADLPASRIDHVLLHRASGFGAVDTRLVFDAPSTRVSDHPGILIRLEGRAPPSVSWTRVTGHVDLGSGRRLTLRGDTAPLDWARGWPMFATDASTWIFATSELRADFEYKVLVDDATWMTGVNAAGVAGADNDVRPAF
jgi:endonuclease/exonuclease/phosphatase family metal-dependent hydrolase